MKTIVISDAFIFIHQRIRYTGILVCVYGGRGLCLKQVIITADAGIKTTGLMKSKVEAFWKQSSGHSAASDAL